MCNGDKRTGVAVERERVRERDRAATEEKSEAMKPRRAARAQVISFVMGLISICHDLHVTQRESVPGEDTASTMTLVFSRVLALLRRVIKRTGHFFRHSHKLMCVFR